MTVFSMIFIQSSNLSPPVQLSLNNFLFVLNRLFRSFALSKFEGIKSYLIGLCKAKKRNDPNVSRLLGVDAIDCWMNHE